MTTESYGNFFVKKYNIAGLMLITPKVFGDERGFFTERYREDIFLEIGIPKPIQENYSRSLSNVLRGLHFQFEKPMSKLVTATRGRILDVAVDIRANSSTFGQHIAVELDGNSPQWFFMPAGFAHGFCVLSSEGADVMYKVDQFYNPKGEGAILWNDQELSIDWILQNPLLSSKDQEAPRFSEYRSSPKF